MRRSSILAALVSLLVVLVPLTGCVSRQPDLHARFLEYLVIKDGTRVALVQPLPGGQPEQTFVDIADLKAGDGVLIRERDGRSWDIPVWEPNADVLSRIDTPAARLVVSPPGSSYTIQRHNGVAHFDYTVTLETTAGPVGPFHGLELQKSVDGVTWRHVPLSGSPGLLAVTGAEGRVPAHLAFKNAGRGYWRWVFDGDASYIRPATSSETIITVR